MKSEFHGTCLQWGRMGELDEASQSHGDRGTLRPEFDFLVSAVAPYTAHVTHRKIVRRCKKDIYH